jgi:hypothetical protein
LTFREDRVRLQTSEGAGRREPTGDEMHRTTIETQPTTFPANRSEVLVLPTADEVSALRPGMLAISPFGSYLPVVEITARRVDVKGNPFVCYSVRTSPTSTITMSFKAGELVRHAALLRSSNDLRQIEARMRADLGIPFLA